MTKIIIVTWNNIELYQRCIYSLLRLTKGSYEVICVNNSGNSETSELNSYLHINEIVTTENVGFIRGVNLALDIVAGEDIVLLNDDTIITDEYWLQKLIDTKKMPDMGAAGATSNMVIGLQAIHLNHQLNKEVHEVPLLVFFCVFITNKAFKDCGKLDERFGLGGNDDLDYSIRLAEKGYKLYINRRCYVFHYGGGSIARIGGYEKVESSTRLQLIDKHGYERVEKLFYDTNKILPIGKW